MRAYQKGMVIQMKKPHACGKNEWLILRTGPEVHLRCLGCHQEQWMRRSEFDKRLRRICEEDGRFVSAHAEERSTPLD